MSNKPKCENCYHYDVCFSVHESIQDLYDNSDCYVDKFEIENALEKVKIMKIEKELKELLTKVCPPDIKPTRCIDPIIKFCQECPWGWCEYPDWVETSEDLCGCTFESGCALGFDKGRPEDEPTAKEIEEFERWYNNAEFKSC